jgi:predicted ATPase
MLGNTLFYFGEFAPARDHFEQSMALYNFGQHHSHAFLYGQDTGVVCLARAAWALWFLGYPDQALKLSYQAMTLARELSHPHSQAYALGSAATLHQLRREGQAAQEQAEAAMTLSTEQGFPLWVAWGTMLRGWALAKQERGEEGTSQIRQGMATFRATGAEVSRPYLPALLAEAYEKAGQVEEGLSSLAEALAAVDNSGERWYEAELYRLKGQLTLQKFQVSSFKFQVPHTPHPTPYTQAEAEAEACFLKAIEIARRQQAKSLELRATVSLARLWQQQGKKEEARQMLAEIYNWFTEGFDTKDLQEAKALLEELEQ